MDTTTGNITSTSSFDISSIPASKRIGFSFSLKWGKLRIYRSTLKALGEPGYIRLLLNKKSKQIAVQSCEQIDRDSYQVPAYENWEQFDISSRKLIKMIYKLAGWEEDKTYRIYGYPVPNFHLVLFFFKEGQEITVAEFDKGLTVSTDE